MFMFSDSSRAIKSFLGKSSLGRFSQAMAFKMVVAFIAHRGRMTCSQAAGFVASEAVHRSQLTRFLRRPRWQKVDFNTALRQLLFQMESGKGEFIFIIDATLTSQAGVKTENCYSTGNTKRRPKKGRRYNKKKVIYKKCHSFTFGLLITPSGIRIPYQIPHYTKKYCEEKGIEHRTTAESAAELIRSLPLPEQAKVVVLGDTAYDAKVVENACNDRGYTWIFPANSERVYQGPTGERPTLRSRLKDWSSLSLKKIRLRASTGKYAGYRRLSRWRVGPKQKTRAYYAYQEKREVRNVGCVKLIFSTMKPNLKKATPNDVKILLTNAINRSVSEIIELYSLRWQIELFFKEIKSTLGFAQYSFRRFEAVKAWAELTITTVLFLEYMRARRLVDRRLKKKTRQWWRMQRLHGLCTAFRQECEARELKYLAERLKTLGGRKKLERLLKAAIPVEYRATA
jgi:hypothetical protein